jgi:predicted SprT family Zn-dependent metalloprotease
MTETHMIFSEPLPKASPIKIQDIKSQSSTPPPTPSMSTLTSPTKISRIPKMPTNDSLSDFWSQQFVDDWHDVHSPKKGTKTPKKSNRNSDDDQPFIVSMTSPTKSPVKKDKAARDAKKAFESRRQKIAEDFIHDLDLKITNGEVSKLAKETGGIRLIWNNKLNSTAGRAHWKKETVTTKHSDGSIDKVYKHHASIELAEKVIDDEYRLYNTLAHEFCHLANFMVSGIKDNPHGREFKAWGKKCTDTFKHLEVKVTTKHSYEIDYKYVWQCVECSTEYKRHSKSIDPEKHRCGRCKSKLAQIKPAVRATKTSDYQVFVKENFKKLKKQHVNESHAFIMKLIGELYREQKSASHSSSAASQAIVGELANQLNVICLD